MAVTVTATASGAGSTNGILLACRVLDNASSTQAGGAATNSTTVTTPQLSITPSASGSWVYGVVGTGASGTAFSSIDANTTSVFNANVVSGSNWGVYRSTSGTTTSPTTYGWGAPSESSGNYFIASAEILASGTLSEDASTPAVADSSSAKTITTASFTPPGTSVLVACVLAQWTGSGAVTIALSDSNSAYTWTQLSATPTEALTSVWVGVPKTTAITTTVAMGFNPAMAATVTVANPVTTTVAMGFNPAMAATVTVKNPVTSTVAVSFTPAIAATGSVLNPVTSTVAMGFNPAMAVAGAATEPTLIMSIAPNAGTDIYGNSYLQGFHLYNDASTLHLNVNQTVSAPQVGLQTGTTSEAGIASVYNWSPNRGASNEFMATIVQGPTSSGTNENCYIALESGAANGSFDSSGSLISSTGGTVAQWNSNGFIGVNGPWQTASLINSWTGSGTGVNGLFYRISIFNEVEIIADIINTTATGNSFCFVLPAGYVPTVGLQNHPAGWNNPATSNSASVPWVTVVNTGGIQVTGIEVANKGIFFHIFAVLGAI